MVRIDPSKLQHDQLIWVRDNQRDSWTEQYFSHYEPRDNLIWCYKDGYNSEMTSGTIYWYFWTDIDPSLPEVISYETWFQ